MSETGEKAGAAAAEIREVRMEVCMGKEWIQAEKERILERLKHSGGQADCRSALALCLPVMEKLLDGAEGPDDWMAYLSDKYRAVYFPDSFPDRVDPAFDRAEAFYLDVLDGLFEWERKNGFLISRDFDSLTNAEAGYSRIAGEFDHFREVFSGLHIYEFLRISQEHTKYDTLGHIAGVHNVALYMARQFQKTPVNVDLGLISAAAVLHDIGKFGCREQEAEKIPYLHYYYTEQFCDRFGLKTIGHTAANHSVWDLEFENLSLENLLLIYADFRVKSIWNREGKEIVCFWTLDESYQIILDKLDNVNEQKRKRYRKVYRKLKDFEGFMEHLGLSPDLSGGFGEPAPAPDPVRITADEIVERIKYRAVCSNIRVMDLLSRESEFLGLLEDVKGEKNWRNVRPSLNVLEEYFTYMTKEQKDLLITYLCGMLMYRDGDIRRQAAGILGKVIAGYDVPYTKEIPEGAELPRRGRTSREIWKKVLEYLLNPGHRVTMQQRRWGGFALKHVFTTVLNRVEEGQKRGIVSELTDCFRSYRLDEWDELNQFLLMDCALTLPLEYCSKSGQKIVYRFSLRALESRNREVTVAVLRFWLFWITKGWKPDEDFPLWDEERFRFMENLPCFLYLKREIERALGRGEKEAEALPESMVSALMFENQKMEVPWVFKAVHLQMFSENFRKSHPPLAMGVHLVNLLQESDRVVIKRMAGELLVEMFPSFTKEERYELVLELLKGIDTGEYAVSRCLPEYLGRVFFSLDDEAMQELTGRYRAMADSKNEQVAVVTLEAVGITLQQTLKYAENQKCALKEKLEGILCRAMAHAENRVRREAFYVLGHSVFGSGEIAAEQKVRCFSGLCKKILFLTEEMPDGDSLYSNAAALNHIYRFLSDYLMDHERVECTFPERAAFFPGTFDPFSLGHKQIVKEVVKLGCEVFVAVDEFSWSKKTQPYNVRKRILQMSIADLEDVYLFPEQIPVNIANPDDMKMLEEMFGEREWYLVVGTDVVENASAYRGSRPVTGKYNHILVERGSKRSDYRDRITGKIEWLRLPPGMERMSSTKIRENIDLNRDISSLVDENVQNYIYSRSLYAAEPQYRQSAKKLPYTGVMETKTEKGAGKEQRVVLREDGGNQRKLAYAGFRRLSLSDLYDECRDAALSAWLREHVSGKIAMLTEMKVCAIRDGGAFKQMLLTELAAYCLENEYTYLLCFRPGDDTELLLDHGFVRAGEESTCYVADLRSPILLFHDTETAVKEPFSNAPAVRGQMEKAHQRIQRALAGLSPGSLVLSVDARVLNYRLICLIQEEISDDAKQLYPEGKEYGMCVPYGKMLCGIQIPNCVTKELHTDKVYENDMSRFSIRETPGWPGLETQIRTLKSFRKPIFLVDDLYHKGFRMEAIDPYLIRAQIPVRKIITGVLSGQGEELAKRRGKKVRSVYFIPNLRAWFSEKDMYPFLGGETVRKNESGEEWPAASVNPILPFQMPHFLSGVSMEAFYVLSRVCLENARDIFAKLENVYQKTYGRKLTVRRLGEVIGEPGYPDISGKPDGEASPSKFIDTEISRLKRLENLARCLRE